jgi:hypothetical protein
VPKVMDANMRQLGILERPIEVVIHCLRAHRFADVAAENEIRVAPIGTQEPLVLCLATAMVCECSTRQLTEDHAATAAATLWFNEDKPCALLLLERPANHNPSDFDIDITPSQRHRLTEAHARGCQQHPQANSITVHHLGGSFDHKSRITAPHHSPTVRHGL